LTIGKFKYEIINSGYISIPIYDAPNLPSKLIAIRFKKISIGPIIKENGPKIVQA
jgi:hypothetical protein